MTLSSLTGEVAIHVGARDVEDSLIVDLSELSLIEGAVSLITGGVNSMLDGRGSSVFLWREIDLDRDNFSGVASLDLA